MNYSLSLSLEGADAVESTLGNLIAQLKQLSGGFTIGSITGSSSSPIVRVTEQTAKGLERGSMASKAIKQNLQDAATAMAQGFGATKNADVLKAAFDTKSEAFKKNNPELYAKLAGMSGGGLSSEVAKDAAKWRQYRMEHLPGLFPFATPGMPDWMGKSFFSTAARRLGNPALEAMNDLSRRGQSQSDINMAGAIAMGDVKINKGLEEAARKLAEIIPPILKPPILQAAMDSRKLTLGLGTALFNPWIGSRLISDALPAGFGGSGGGRGGGIAKGIFGAGGAMGFGEIYLAIEGVKFVVDTFKKAIEGLAAIVQKATSQAFTFYTQAVQQGLGAQFFTQRSILSSVLGVSGDQNQIYRFGAAVSNLSQRLLDAITVISVNEKPLAATAMNFKVLKVDIDALYSEIASALAPSLDVVVYKMENFVKGLTDLLFVYDKLTNKSKEFAWAIDLAFNYATSFSASSAIAKTVKDMAQIQGNNASLTNPLQYMKQLPASTWEKMGLVVGGGMGNSIPALLRQSNNYLKIIATHIVRNGNPYDSRGRLASSMLDPRTANP